MSGRLLDHVHPHLAQRDRVTEPGGAGVIEVQLADYAVGYRERPGEEGQDLVRRLVFGDAEIGVLIVLVEWKRLRRPAERFTSSSATCSPSRRSSLRAASI